jgi:DNA-directed RNA polymerase alpha subunit
MLDLEKLHELARITVQRVKRDYPEDDKILIDIEEIITEAVRQHAKVLLEQKHSIKLEESLNQKDMSVRVYNCLKRYGIDYISDLIHIQDYQIERIRNIGRKEAEEIREIIKFWKDKME